MIEKLAADGAEVLRFEEDAPAEAVSDALLNRSLFSPQRIVVFDISRLLGTETPGRLLEQAVEAWGKGTPAGKREAYRYARSLLSALDLVVSEPAEEVAEAAARKARKKDLASPLAEILRALPEEHGGPAVLVSALRLLLEREKDGTVALLTATAPPSGVDLLAEISKRGLVLDVSVGGKRGDLAPELARLARARAKEREVVIDADAIERLRVLTDENPGVFAAEVEKLLEWAGAGGHVRAADVSAGVEDEAGEDLYEFFEAIGRRDAGDVLTRLERLFSGRAVRRGDQEIDTEVYWPTRSSACSPMKCGRCCSCGHEWRSPAGVWTRRRATERSRRESFRCSPSLWRRSASLPSRARGADLPVCLVQGGPARASRSRPGSSRQRSPVRPTSTSSSRTRPSRSKR